MENEKAEEMVRLVPNRYDLALPLEVGCISLSSLPIKIKYIPFSLVTLLLLVALPLTQSVIVHAIHMQTFILLNKIYYRTHVR